MRLCPSVEGTASPLITHRIGTDVCMARQRTFFHKCHRCIYRGQAADWEPEASPLAMLNVHAAEEPVHADVREVALERPAAAAAARAAKTPAKAAPKAAQQSDKAADKAGKPEKAGKSSKPKARSKAPEAAIEATSPVG